MLVLASFTQFLKTLATVGDTKVVLTSTDLKYREKLSNIQLILSKLQPDDGFFLLMSLGHLQSK